MQLNFEPTERHRQQQHSRYAEHQDQPGAEAYLFVGFTRVKQRWQAGYQQKGHQCLIEVVIHGIQRAHRAHFVLIDHQLVIEARYQVIKQRN